MDIVNLLSTSRILLRPELPSKKRTFELLAALLAKDLSVELTEENIFDALINREKLGSTAIGNGIAIPHTALPVQQPIAALLYSREGLDKMDSPDKRPVQLFLTILVPEHESHHYSSMMTELTLELSRSNICAHISHYDDPQVVMDYLVQHFSREMAA